MKKTLTLLFLTCGLGLYSQASFHYKFKINNVTNLAEAKMITDPLRYKFKTYPTFIDSTDYFEFDTDTDIYETDVTSILSPLNYALIEFSKTKYITSPIINATEK